MAEILAITRIARGVGRASGSRRWLLGIGLGVVAAGAMPPFNLVPLLLVAIPGLVWLVEGARSWRQAARDGWRFGFGFFVPCLYWTTISMFVDIGQFWFMVPFALLGLPAYLAGYTGFAAGVARARLGRVRFPVSSPRGILWFAVAWSASEWLRGTLLTGFPWVLLGYTWSADQPVLLAVLQSASAIGIYGLGFLSFLIFGLPACLGGACGLSAGDGLSHPAGQIRRYPALAALGLVAALGLGGGFRLASHPDPALPHARLRIVQPGTPETAVWSEQAAAADFRRLLTLAASPAPAPLAAEIWPEGSVGYLLNREPAIRAAIAGVVPPGGVVIAGTLTANPDGPIRQVWNSVGVIDSTGDLIATYDKVHLVPFGEYVPLRRFLPINPIVADRADFSTGPGPLSLTLPDLPAVAPFICYEAIFPHTLVDERRRPGWLVNVTDDGWFGRSTGPYQHFAIARVRAVEEGLPLIRAANTGISGGFDSYGRTIARLGLGRIGVLDVDLPKATAQAPLYARFGDAILAGILTLATGLVWLPGLAQSVVSHPPRSRAA